MDSVNKDNFIQTSVKYVNVRYFCHLVPFFCWPTLHEVNASMQFGACCKCHKVRKSVLSLLSTFLLMFFARFESGSR